MASKLTTSNRAGWGFALPGFGLLALFIVVPFFFAFFLSLTNQRLISPNPTEYVGLENRCSRLKKDDVDTAENKPRNDSDKETISNHRW